MPSRVSSYAVVVALGSVLLAGCIQSSTSTLLGGENPGDSSGSWGEGGAAASSSASGSHAQGATTGSGSSMGTSMTTGSGMPAMWDASTDAAQLDADLEDQAVVTVTLDPKGFKGDVMLEATGLPGDVDASFESPSVTLDGSATMTDKLTLKTHSSTVTGDLAFKITASSAGQNMDFPTTLTVNAVLTIHIPQGIDNMSGGDSYGPNPFMISAKGIDQNHPVTVNFMNDDGKEHQVHAESPEFKHDPNPIPAHSMDPYVRTPHDPGTYQFYLHDEGGAQNAGAVRIQ